MPAPARRDCARCRQRRGSATSTSPSRSLSASLRSSAWTSARRVSASQPGPPASEPDDRIPGAPIARDRAAATSSRRPRAGGSRDHGSARAAAAARASRTASPSGIQPGAEAKADRKPCAARLVEGEVLHPPRSIRPSCACDMPAAAPAAALGRCRAGIRPRHSASSSPQLLPSAASRARVAARQPRARPSLIDAACCAERRCTCRSIRRSTALGSLGVPLGADASRPDRRTSIRRSARMATSAVKRRGIGAERAAGRPGGRSRGPRATARRDHCDGSRRERERGARITTTPPDEAGGRSMRAKPRPLQDARAAALPGRLELRRARRRAPAHARPRRPTRSSPSTSSR